MNLQSTRTLNDGVEMPLLGLGVFRAQDGQETANAVRWALEAGYRHIDTAKLYENEKGVGEGVRQSGVPREQVFVTTKAWVDDMRAGQTRRGLENSLELLGMDYVDMYMIHWPIDDGFIEAFREMAVMKQEGLIRSISVSNCHPRHFEALLEQTGLIPSVNQIEIHPLLSQVPLVEYCEKLGCAPQAYSPLGRGTLLEDEVLVNIGQQCGKSPAQVVIRWHLQRNILVIPKSVHKERIEHNAQVFDFELSAEQMAAIDGLNQNLRLGPDPDTRKY